MLVFSVVILEWTRGEGEERKDIRSIWANGELCDFADTVLDEEFVDCVHGALVEVLSFVPVGEDVLLWKLSWADVDSSKGIC